MSFDSDAMFDRRRIRRKLTFWRVVALLLVVVGLGAAVLTWSRGSGESFQTGPSIARVSFKGLIRGDLERVQSLDRLARSNARAVIVHVDSPGGTTAGSEQLYVAIRHIAERKPTVIVIDSVAASGGYIAALAGEHIIAQGSAVVGSIGVLVQYPNFYDLISKLGVKVEEVKSSPLKAAPNGLSPTSPEALAALDSLVKETYSWFRSLVKERRNLDDSLLAQVSDGRVFTGRQAIGLKLIDQIGNERTARDWLAQNKGISIDTPVRDWRLTSRFSQLSFLHLAGAAMLDSLGLSSLARGIEESGAAFERLNLDGLLTLWHPAAVR